MTYTLVSYGGGTNSTALLVGLHERDQRPDAITFADTGGEKPHTYDHIEWVRAWCLRVGFPDITVVKGDQPAQVRRGSLEAECLELGTMPSKVFGRSGCSLKWKVEPQNKFNRKFCEEHGASIEQLVRLVGFDADEPHRAERGRELTEKRIAEGLRIPRERYPLVEWGWGREECVAAIARAGLPQPGKSACWFCPSSTKREVEWLRDNLPDLYERAVRMERRALAGEGQAPVPTTVKGLGRHWSWENVAGVPASESHGTPEVDCGCYDGE